MSRTVRILGEFGDESNLPLRLSPHAGVVPVIHAFKGSTEAFQRFLGVQYTEEAVREDRLQMTRQTWMVRPQGACRSTVLGEVVWVEGGKLCV